MLKKSVSDSSIDTLHKKMWDEAISQFGDAYRVPREVSQKISDFTRALHVLQVWEREKNGNPVRTLISYGIPQSTISEVAPQYCGVKLDDEKSVVEEVRSEKRADKWDSFLKWANQHHFEQFTTEQLTEKSGFSYPTTLKYLQESPTFRKIKKGVWEVRDAKADREAGV